MHIGQMVAKAYQRANAILRSFVSRDVALLIRAFIVYVRPIRHITEFTENQLL